MYGFHDLPIPEEEGDIFEYIMSDRLSASAEEIALRALTMESLHMLFSKSLDLFRLSEYNNFLYP